MNRSFFLFPISRSRVECGDVCVGGYRGLKVFTGLRVERHVEAGGTVVQVLLVLVLLVLCCWLE